jgi:crossover junction endodeoxyribonuclease RusA
VLPFEIVVVGTPISHQSHNKPKLREWQESVREAARKALPENTTPVKTKCLVIVVYFFGQTPALLDNDNLLKPIQDALSGLVYEDDRQVTDTVIRRTYIGGLFRIPGRSRSLVEAIEQGEEFVYVRVEEAPDHTEVP